MHFSEHKRLMDILDTEREQILIEKTKLETMERIKPTASNASTKRYSEIDAAIKIAQVERNTIDDLLTCQRSNMLWKLNGCQFCFVSFFLFFGFFI